MECNSFLPFRVPRLFPPKIAKWQMTRTNHVVRCQCLQDIISRTLGHTVTLSSDRSLQLSHGQRTQDDFIA